MAEARSLVEKLESLRAQAGDSAEKKPESSIVKKLESLKDKESSEGVSGFAGSVADIVVESFREMGESLLHGIVQGTMIAPDLLEMGMSEADMSMRQSALFGNSEDAINALQHYGIIRPDAQRGDGFGRLFWEELGGGLGAVVGLPALLMIPGVKEAGATALLGGEVVSALGSAAALKAERELVGGGATSETVARIGGSMTATSTLGIGRRIRQLHSMHIAAKNIKGGQGGPSGLSLERASRAIQDHAADSETASKALQNPPELGEGTLTAAAQSEDIGLMRLQRRFETAGGTSAAFETRVRKIHDNLNETAKSWINNIFRAPPGDRVGEIVAQRWVTDQIDNISRTVDKKAQAAVDAANMRIKALTQSARGKVKIKDFEAGKIFRHELDETYKSARVAEKAMWDAVDDNVPISKLDTFWATLGEVQSELLENGKELPPWFRRLVPSEDTLAKIKKSKRADELLGNLFFPGKTENLQRTRTLRSQLQTEALNAASGATPNRSMAEKLTRLQDSLLDDITRELGSQGAGKDYENAVAFSRALNDRFTRGDVGEIMGLVRTGDKAISPDESIVKLLKGDVTGNRAARAIIDAFAHVDDARAMWALRQGATAEYLKVATKHGTNEIDAAAGQLWINKHENWLNNFPGLKAELQDVTAMSRQLEVNPALQKAIAKPEALRAKAKLFLDADPDRAVGAVMNKSINRVKNMKFLIRMASKDPSGDAIQGLRQGMWRWISDTASEADGTINAQGLQKIISQSGPVLRQLYGQGGVKAIHTLQREIAKASAVAKVFGKAGEVDAENLNMMTKILARLFGTNLVAAAGSPSLIVQAAVAKGSEGLLKSFSLNQMNAIIAEALEDRQLMHLLLTRTREAPKNYPIVLRAHLANAGIIAHEPEASSIPGPSVPLRILEP